MTNDEFDVACRAFRRRRPFQAFVIEFVSGAAIRIVHPEAIYDEGDLYVIRFPDGGYTVFAAGSVTRLTDQRGE
jgi:hypothetical protein